MPLSARYNPRVYVTAILAFRALVALSLSGIAFAQTQWPERPIQLIVPFPAGGGVDVIARSFAELFGELLQQPVVVIARVYTFPPEAPEGILSRSTRWLGV